MLETNSLLIPIPGENANDRNDCTHLIYYEEKKEESNNLELLKFIKVPIITIQIIGKLKIRTYKMQYFIALSRFGFINYTKIYQFENFYGENLTDIFARYIIYKIFSKFPHIDKSKKKYNYYEEGYLATIYM